MNEKVELSFTAKILRIFLLLAFGFLLTSYSRTVSAIISAPVEHDLHLTTTMMGFITSTFFFGYALAQIPTGMLFDRYGAKRTQGGLFILASIGAILFGIGSNITLLIIGRLLMGIGFAGGLTIAFAENRLRFSEKSLPILNSLTFACGGLGAVASAVPTERLLEITSWHTILISLGIITFVSAIIILVLVPKDPAKEHYLTMNELFSGLKKVFKDRYFWKIAPLVNISTAAILSMLTYWISPWLRETIDAGPRTISIYLLIAAIAMIFSTPTSGILSSFFANRKHHKEWICGIGIALSIVSQILIVLQIWTHTEVLWALFSYFSFFTPLLLTGLTLHFPPELSGRAITAIEVLTFICAFILQYLFGIIAVVSFSAAFWTYIILQTLALIWFCVAKVEKHVA